MITKKRLVIALIVASGVAAGAVYAGMDNPTSPVEYFSGHTHGPDGTHGAPSHSGGLDRNGCHNRSVPYHCH